MRILKLMVDYGCFPLWEASPGQVGNVDPRSLPISEVLKMDLEGWAMSYDKTLNPDDPMNSGFADDKDEQRFRLEGRKLGERLRHELGAEFEIMIEV